MSVFIGDNGVSKPNFKFSSGRVNVLEVTILAVAKQTALVQLLENLFFTLNIVDHNNVTER